MNLMKTILPALAFFYFTTSSLFSITLTIINEDFRNYGSTTRLTVMGCYEDDKSIRKFVDIPSEESTKSSNEKYEIEMPDKYDENKDIKSINVDLVIRDRAAPSFDDTIAATALTMGRYEFKNNEIKDLVIQLKCIQSIIEQKHIK